MWIFRRACRPELDARPAEAAPLVRFHAEIQYQFDAAQARITLFSGELGGFGGRGGSSSDSVVLRAA